MHLRDIRSKFLHFFTTKGHVAIRSSSLIPVGDASVLLTTAGMQQFKPYFLGERDVEADLKSRKLTSVQKCFRTSDITEVGDATHLTFFEMLGNFSVGDYFKKEVIDLAWEFCTKVVYLHSDRLWATYYHAETTRGKKNLGIPSDTESVKYWQAHLPKERIAGFGHDENFWGPPGKTGPCGPSTELHYDRTGKPCDLGAKCLPNCDCGRFVEIWNLVLMQYQKTETGEYQELPQKNIDTGMGLERLAMVLQDKQSVFQTEAFTHIIETIQQDERFDSTGEVLEDERRLRIASDHFKAAMFLRADEVRFSNKEQGYILRRVFRRACDQYLHPGCTFEPVIDAIIHEYGEAYPELKEKRAAILEDFQKEYGNYEKVRMMDIGKLVKQLPKEDILSQQEVQQGVSKIHITGKAAVQLFTTYGSTFDQLKQKGFTFDDAEVEAELDKHRATSRAGATAKFGGHGLNSATLTDDERAVMTRMHTATHLLHQALRDVLGPEVHQDGSDINPERLRFDFTYPEKLSADEILKVETIVNGKIAEDLPVTMQEMPLKEAQASGALAFFKEKYPDPVKVYSVGDYSKEFCGGPHVQHTGELGSFKIISEKSVSAGIRRIKATVGK
ncbi:MAG: alanine--tRNA ligase [bacterium]|nr:alanine--tRNA ligase [bacterium]